MLEALAALAQPTRLDVFRLLVKVGPDGLLAGEISDRLDVRPNTLSTNLAILHRASLVRSTRSGRHIRYFADMDGVRALMGALLQDCCGGNPALCKPVLDQITYREADA